jgi:hypothetical protein
LFPAIHIGTIPDHDEKRTQAAIVYATKNHQVGLQHGPVPDTAEPEHIAPCDQRWLQIIEMAEEGRLQEILRRFPREYVAKLAHIEIIATRAALARRPCEPLSKDDLIHRNLFLWGDPGTGKTYWGYALCGEFPILKGQDK